MNYYSSSVRFRACGFGVSMKEFPKREDPTWRGRGLSKSFISRVIIGATPFRVLITLLITYLLSPCPSKYYSTQNSRMLVLRTPKIRYP